MLNQAGVPDRRILGIFANGFHRPHTPAERRAVVGDEAFGRIELVDHATTDPMTSLRPTRRGTPVAINQVVADVDRRILTGSIVHHWIAGYGGGRKAILPGVAAYETNVANHALMLEPGSRVGKLAGNPVHEDMIEAVAQLRPDFLLNSIVSPAGEITDVVAGDWIAAHEAGCAIVDRRFGVALAAPADVVIASCGGYPRDINVYQAQKALENALRAARPGGAVILVAECRDGHGSAPFLDWMRRHRSTAELEERLRREFVLGGHKAFGYARLLDQARVILVSALPDALARELWLEPAASVEAALAALDGAGTIVAMPHAAITYPLVREQVAA
jgi:nickel-dependent lactate racemase